MTAENAYAFFEKFLSLAAVEISKPIAERIEEERRLGKETFAEQRELYKKVSSGRLAKNIEETQRSIEKARKEIEELQVALTKRIREARGLQNKLSQLTAVGTDNLELFAKGFEKLMSLPRVLRVVVAGSVINVFTDVLYCVNPNTKSRHEIGRFRIEIYTDGSEGGVKWFNLTRRIDGQNAPHVYSGGDACLGNVSQLFPQLIADHEYEAVAMLAMTFVESVDPTDTMGSSIKKWPIVNIETAATIAA